MSSRAPCRLQWTTLYLVHDNKTEWNSRELGSGDPRIGWQKVLGNYLAGTPGICQFLFSGRIIKFRTKTPKYSKRKCACVNVLMWKMLHMSKNIARIANAVQRHS